MPRTPPDFSHIEHWVFDLDGTLYGPHTGFMAYLKNTFVDFMASTYGFTRTEAMLAVNVYAGHLKHPGAFSFKEPENLSEAWEEYLLTHLDTQKLTRCTETIALLEQLTARKIVFTNSHATLAKLTLERLGLHATFEQVHAINTRDNLPKHDVRAFHHMLNHGQIGDPTTAVLIEDSVHNLEHAKDLGMTTVLVYSTTDAPHVDFCYPDLTTFLQDAIAGQTPKNG